MLANQPDLAADDSAFRDLLFRRGRELELRHLAELEAELGPAARPVYPMGYFAAGHRETLSAVGNNAPVIYQAVLLDDTNRFLAIPDFLVLNPATGRYVIRDVKLAVNLDDHPEIRLQLGLYQAVMEAVLRYSPEVEVVTGDGAVTPFAPAGREELLAAVNRFNELRTAAESPYEPVGWSKCNPCVFRASCWDPAVAQRDVATVPHVDQGLCRKLRDLGICEFGQLHEFNEDDLAGLSRPWGRKQQRVGPVRAGKIKRQVDVLVTGNVMVESRPALPPGCAPGTRPVVIFDIENDVFDPELGVKVYLWGCLLAPPDGPPKPHLVVAGPGAEGDRQGWFDFLDLAERLFSEYADLPLIHYSAHEKTWVKNYVERYGDPRGVADRVQKNLWDMYACIQNSLFIPAPSYGLKSVESLVGFKRSQEEFGGLWSIITYDRYLNAAAESDAQAILDEILTYNTEDLLASLVVYEWLEAFCR
jgi:predicted RecB family nuclease